MKNEKNAGNQTYPVRMHVHQSETEEVSLYNTSGFVVVATSKRLIRKGTYMHVVVGNLILPRY
jgi:hypothetical protein